MKELIKGFINNFSWWQTIIAIVITLWTVGIVTVFIMFIVSKIKGVKNFSLFGLKAEKDIEKKSSAKGHSTCPFRFNLMTVHTLICDASLKVHWIMNREILAEQMNKVEQYVLQLKDMCLAEHCKAIKKVMLNNRIDGIPSQHEDHLNYELALKVYFSRFRDAMRAACINNGFHELSGAQYNEYIKGRIKMLTDKAKRYFAENIISSIVDLCDVYTNSFNQEIDKLITEMFDDLKLIAEKNFKKIVEITKWKKIILKREWGIDFELFQKNAPSDVL